MEKLIEIDNKKVPFKATGGTLRRYRSKFGRDMIADMDALLKNYTKNKEEGGNLERANLEIFENVAYIMAKQADSSVPDDPDEWLDEFNMFSIWQVLPQIIDLWQTQQLPLAELKKK